MPASPSPMGRAPSRPTAFRRLRGLALAGIAVGLLPGCEGGEGRDRAEAPLPVEALEVFLEAGGRDPGDAVFEEAEFALVLAQVARDTPPLVAALGDPDPLLRARAALALGSVQDPAAREALETRLDDPDPVVRGYVAFALGQIPAPDGGLRLLEALRNTPADDPALAPVRLRLLEALGRQGGPPVVEALLGPEAAAGAETPGAAPLTGASPALGPDTLRPFHPAGDAEAVARQWALARLLLRIPPAEAPGAAEGLVTQHLAALGAPQPGVGEAAAWGLSRVLDAGRWASEADRLREILDGLEPGDPALLPILGALGRLQDAADLPRFSTLLQEAPDWRIRTVAARAIGARGWVPREGAREALREAMERDPSGHVRIAAAEALAVLLPPEPLPFFEAQLRRVEREPEGWASQAPFLVPLVQEQRIGPVLQWVRSLRANEPAGFAFGVDVGVRALAGHADPEVTRLLLELSADPHPGVQAAGVRGLAARWDHLDGEGLALAAERLAEVARDGPLAAAVAAITGLGHPVFHGFGAVPALEAALEAVEVRAAEDLGNPTLRKEALLVALGETGDPALRPRLEAALSDPRPAVRSAAATGIERLTGVRPRGLNLPDTGPTPTLAGLRALGPEPRWILETERGEVVVRLLPRLAPQTVETLAGLSAEGRYDATPFHRVIGAFVAQGGDVALGTGTGSPGFAIRSELTPLPFVRGVAAMASAGKDTEGSQFFLTHAAQPHLDAGYTVFGWVESGGEVMDALLPGDLLLRARVEPAGGG